jgi:hypothetical protein
MRMKQRKKEAQRMQQSDQHEREPKGPTTGPLRPLIVVMETNGEEGPLPDHDDQQKSDEQDCLPSVPEEVSASVPVLPQEASDGPKPPQHEPRALSLPVSVARSRRPFSLLIALVGMVLLLLGVVLGTLLVVSPASLGLVIAWLPSITPTASVTLTPVYHNLHITVPITAVTGTPDPTRRQVSARLLAARSSTFTQTVLTTGHGHTQAEQAQGTITFYNAAPYAQTVAAGTVLTGADGVQLVTDQAASLPAGNLPAVGIVTVSAQAVQVGPKGNIAPLDLNGLCCVAGVSVKNTDTFTGGQNTRDYAVVARRDVDAIIGPQSATLAQQAQASLQGEVHPNEQLTSPTQCHPTVGTNHPVGSEATKVTISLTVTCQAEVYDQQAAQQIASAILSEQARKALGTGYGVQSTIKATVSQIATDEQAHGTLSLLVSAQGSWSYQFDNSEISRLTRQIAGLPRQQALSLLRRVTHVQAVQITETWNATSLPNDPAHIQVMVLSVLGG